MMVGYAEINIEQIKELIRIELAKSGNITLEFTPCNTKISVKRPQTRVVHCLSNISVMIKRNITTNIITAKI